MKHFIFTSIITFAAVAAQADSVALKQRIARGLNMHPAIECVSTFEHTENTRVQHTTDRSLIIDVQVVFAN